MNLRSISQYILVFIVLILIIGCGNKKPDMGATQAPSTYENPTKVKSGFYKNSDFNIEVNNPVGWEISEEYEDGNIVFKSPSEKIYDFREYVTIGIDDLSKNPYSLDEYTDLYVNAITEAHKKSKEFKILEIDHSPLAGTEGNKIVFRVATTEIEYESLPKETPIKILRIWTIKNDIAYIFTYVSEEEKYNEFIDEVEIMVNSLKIMQ